MPRCLCVQIYAFYKENRPIGLGPPAPGGPHLNKFHLQRPCFQTRPCSEVRRVVIRLRNLGGDQIQPIIPGYTSYLKDPLPSLSEIHLSTSFSSGHSVAQEIVGAPPSNRGSIYPPSRHRAGRPQNQTVSSVLFQVTLEARELNHFKADLGSGFTSYFRFCFNSC